MTETRCWKWTRRDYRTYNDMPWGEGIEHSVPKWTGRLCTGGVIHAYQDPWLAVVMKPAHGYWSDDCILWEAEATGRMVVAPDKIGCETLRTVQRVEPPVIALDQRVEIAIRCAMAALPAHEWAQTWRAWAEKWLSGEDRSHESANIIAVNTDSSAPYVAAAGATNAAAYTAAVDAVDAAHAAARAAVANNAADTMYIAYTTAYAAGYAARANRDLDIIAIIHQVCGAEKKEVQP